MTYRGIIKGGTIVLDPGVELPEGQRVSIRVEMPTPAADSVIDDPLLALPDLAVETGVDDLATNIDHYLYGHPKSDRVG